MIFSHALLRCEMGIQVIQGDATDRGFYIDFFLSGSLPVDFSSRVEEMYRVLTQEGHPIRRVERLRQNAIDWCKLKGQTLRARLLQTNAANTLSLAAFGEHLEPCFGPVATRVGQAELILGDVISANLSIGKYLQPISRIQVVLASDRKAAHRFRKSLKNYLKCGLAHVDQGSSQKLFAKVLDPPIWVWQQRGLSCIAKLTRWWRELQRDRNIEIFGACEFHFGAIWGKFPQRLGAAPASVFALVAAERAGQARQQLRNRIFRVGALEILQESLQPGQREGLLSKESFTRDSTWVFCAKEQLLVELISILQLIETVISIAGFKGIWVCNSKCAHGRCRGLQAELAQLLECALKDATLPKVVDDSDLVTRWPSATVNIQCELGHWWPVGFVKFENRPQSDAFGQKANDPTHLPMLNYSILGSFERFFALILERNGGILPIWLAPEQVRLIATTKQEQLANFEAQEVFHEFGIDVKVEGNIGEMSPTPSQALAPGIPYLAVSDFSKGSGNWLRVWDFAAQSWHLVETRAFAEQLGQQITSQAKRWSLKEGI